MTNPNALNRASRLKAMLSAALWDKWFVGKDFTEDWSSAAYPVWMTALGSLKPTRILEIGSFEGRSAIFWLEQFPECQLTCIDHFATTKWREGREIEDRFDRNLARYSGRVTKIKQSSAVALAALAGKHSRFDLILIDGSHFRDDVLIDALFSWKLIDPGGIIIFDDYLLDLERDPKERPKDGIDNFLALHAGEFEEISRGHQIIIKKL